MLHEDGKRAGTNLLASGVCLCVCVLVCVCVGMCVSMSACGHLLFVKI